MQTDLIKLEIKESASSGEMATKIISSFIQACEKLNASSFEPLIDEEQYFQDKNKYRFLQSLKDEFDRVKEKGIVITVLIMGKCEGCYLGEETYQFYGKSEIPEFSYIIRKGERGEVQDIFRCNLSIGLNVTRMQKFMGFDFCG